MLALPATARGVSLARAQGMGARSSPRYWSQHVTETSNALDLEPDVFKLESPRAIAESLKRSAEQSTRRKAEPYRSALSMLVFYINRAGKNLSAERRRVLERAKDELRVLFGRPTSKTGTAFAAAAKTGTAFAAPSARDTSAREAAKGSSYRATKPRRGRRAAPSTSVRPSRTRPASAR
jgi:hypothetical protein